MSRVLSRLVRTDSEELISFFSRCCDCLKASVGDALTLLTASCIYSDSLGSVRRGLAVPPAWTSRSFCTRDGLCLCGHGWERRFRGTAGGRKPRLHRRAYLTVSSLAGAGLWGFFQVVFVKLRASRYSCWEVMMEKLVLLNFIPCSNKS